MTTFRVLWSRFAAAIGLRRSTDDFDEELESLIQFHVDEHVRQGVHPDDAHRQALIRIGGRQSLRQTYRERRGLPAIETTVQDARFAFRMLRRHRAYTVVALLTLALGVATATTMFSIVDAVMLRPFPFAAPERLVVFWETNRARAIDTFTVSPANYTDWRAAATTFSDLGAWELRRDNRTDGPSPEHVQSAVASSPFFRALQLTPAAGRFFTDAEDQPAGRFVAVLGYEYWRREFNADPAAVGRSIVLNGEAHTIVGVMPALRQPFAADVWRPLAANVAELDRGDHSLLVVGRLAGNQTLASSEAELQTIAARLAERYEESNRGWSVRGETLYDAVVPQRTRRSMTMLLAAVGLLVLIACGNVASLTLARGTTRARELATRSALGAGRARLVRQLFTESLVIAVLGGAFGIVAAWWLLDVVEWLYPADMPGLADARLDPLSLAFAAATAAATTAVFGLIPALRLSDPGASPESLSTRSVTAGPRARRLTHMFVAAELAIALVLLVGSGLLLASVNRLLSVPLGFGGERVVTGRIALTDRRYENDDTYRGFTQRLLSELQGSPGVVSAGFTSSVPFDGAYTAMQVRHERDRDVPAADGVLAQWRVIGGDYLATIGIPLLKGRAFEDTDAGGVPRVTIISEPLARRMFGDEDPIGRQILVSDSRRPYRVIGVAGAARLTALDGAPDLTMYFHHLQFGWQTLSVVARGAGDPRTLTGVIRAAVTAADPAQPVFEERELPAVVDAAAAAPRMNAALLSTFAALALVLAAVGVYGTMSYAATQRIPEMSVRLVLGARPASVFFAMLSAGAKVILVGIALGLVAAMALAGTVKALLYDISAHDPVIYAAAAGFVIVFAIIACALPARRAMRVDPTLALRQQ
jgi:putative ABC transport system permease protein